MSAEPRAHCVAVRATPQGPNAADLPALEMRRWTADGAEAERWHAAAPGSKLASFTRAQAEGLPLKLRAEALAVLR